MELDGADEARKIAQYVVPRLLFELPQEMKMRLMRPGENEESMLSRLIEKAASDIRHMAISLKNQEHEQSL